MFGGGFSALRAVSAAACPASAPAATPLATPCKKRRRDFEERSIASVMPASPIASFIRIALLGPGIAAIVIAAHLPKAWVIARRDLDLLQPFGAFPEIEVR